MGLLTRLDRALQGIASRAAEGEPREGPHYLPVTGGWLPSGAGWNFWQAGIDPATSGGQTSMVEACVSAYAQTVAMCPGNHWKWAPADGRSRVSGSALVRILRQPNTYQSISDFLLNAVSSLLFEGNFYALALRNDRYEVRELHLMHPRHCGAHIAKTGEVFYHVGGNPIVERMFGHNLVVPARDILHVKLRTSRDPLRGETPLAAAALQMAAGNTALQHQINFFLNQGRPSFVLVSDREYDAKQVRDLRARWNEQTQGVNQGGTPILTHGLKAEKLGMTAQDAQLIEMLKLSDQAVADVYRVPLQVLGRGEGGAAPKATTEALMQQWKAGGLGFLLNHIEEGMGLFFRLVGQPDEYLEFDTSALLRSNFKERVEAWVAGTKGGVFDRNTARADFELAPVKFGDEPWVQQQDIPLSVAGKNANNPPVPPTSAPAGDPPAPAAAPDNDNALAFEAQRALLAISKGLA